MCLIESLSSAPASWCAPLNRRAGRIKHRERERLHERADDSLCPFFGRFALRIFATPGIHAHWLVSTIVHWFHDRHTTLQHRAVHLVVTAAEFSIPAGIILAIVVAGKWTTCTPTAPSVLPPEPSRGAFAVGNHPAWVFVAVRHFRFPKLTHHTRVRPHCPFAHEADGAGEDARAVPPG